MKSMLLSVYTSTYFFQLADVLTKNLVNEAVAWDHKENFNKAPCQRTTAHVDALKQAIASCGISFNIWEKKNADGKASGLFEFTSLMGSDKKILMKELPPKLKDILKPKSCNTIVQIWEVGNNILIIYCTASSNEC
jgi:hypothetical protein